METTKMGSGRQCCTWFDSLNLINLCQIFKVIRFNLGIISQNYNYYTVIEPNYF